MDNRPDWDEIFLGMADLVATRASCERLQVGCVITDYSHQRILAFGYNGNYAGGPNTCDDSERVGGCGCIHAEANALFKCDNSIKDKIIYVTHAPCVMCAKAIINSGAAMVVYSQAYRITEGVNLLENAGIDTVWIQEIDDESDEDSG